MMVKGAIFEEERKYRYILTRIWDDSKPKAMCIGLNPSTANDEKDDATIRILIKVLTKFGYGGFYMANLFSLCSSKPEDLRSCPDPIRKNDMFLKWYSEEVEDIIFCWGQFKQAKYRIKQVAPMFPSAKCFGKNTDGSPLHPMGIMWGGMMKNPKLESYA